MKIVSMVEFISLYDCFVGSLLRTEPTNEFFLLYTSLCQCTSNLESFGDLGYLCIDCIKCSWILCVWSMRKSVERLSRLVGVRGQVFNFKSTMLL